MKSLNERTRQLSQVFSLKRKVELEDTGIDILPYRFHERMDEKEVVRFQKKAPRMKFYRDDDDRLRSNERFRYTVFAPKGAKDCSNGILVLHGLNERMWDKYLPWAEYLCLQTGKPVILFPIAFHLNRAPITWVNPKVMQPFVEQRRKDFNAPNCTFANAALSSRLSQSPMRFYISGRESIFNVVQLLEQIKDGAHPLFSKEADINVFAYSIGALLSETLMLANPAGLFDSTRFFFFCGGSLFEKMNGSNKEIMDSDAFRRMYEFYTSDFTFKDDYIEDAFKSMILQETNQKAREQFFSHAANNGRIKAITLTKDTVMPTSGAQAAFGADAAPKMLTEMDFPFKYTHQKPFPIGSGIDPQTLDACFSHVFDKACEQLI
jgi:hypothetical protein